MKRTAQKDVVILTSEETRRDLKIIAAVTGSTMKAVVARLASTERKRVAPQQEVKR